MKLLWYNIRPIRSLGPGSRWRYAQTLLEVEMYRLWCKLRGREFKFPFLRMEPGISDDETNPRLVLQSFWQIVLSDNPTDFGASGGPYLPA